MRQTILLFLFVSTTGCQSFMTETDRQVYDEFASLFENEKEKVATKGQDKPKEDAKKL